MRSRRIRLVLAALAMLAVFLTIARTLWTRDSGRAKAVSAPALGQVESDGKSALVSDAAPPASDAPRAAEPPSASTARTMPDVSGTPRPREPRPTSSVSGRAVDIGGNPLAGVRVLAKFAV